MPVREKRYYVYIMASKGRVLYVGVTGFLFARVLQHKSGETEIKKWRREKKIALIEAANATWEDLAADWGKPAEMKTADSSLRSE